MSFVFGWIRALCVCACCAGPNLDVWGVTPVAAAKAGGFGVDSAIVVALREHGGHAFEALEARPHVGVSEASGLERCMRPRAIHEASCHKDIAREATLSISWERKIGRGQWEVTHTRLHIPHTSTRGCIFHTRWHIPHTVAYPTHTVGIPQTVAYSAHGCTHVPHTVA